ncbi:MAG: phenylalanine--tRNA ligase subunit beta [Candidatus Aenigmarchaeota archaeon]|nr:phenylalanine--tRNA ligase subunit beta [Candidatus Aenigmarchaeota archaeon]
MPSIEVSYKDLCSLIGKKISLEELRDAVLYAKGEIERISKDLIKIDIKDSNRPDLWSAEGIAREISGRIKKAGLPRYEVKKSKVLVEVDKRVSKIRPLTVCAVVRRLKINKAVLSQIIQLQEKVCNTFGRNRREVALGVYDLSKIKPPIRYTTVKPDGIKFVPLDFKERLTPREVLEKHPKGKEFGHLLKGFPEYPMFIDSANEVLSIPPIINSEYSGKVTEKTKEVFIECSGFNFKFLIPALNVMACALADRKGRIESVKVVYPDKVIFTPDLKPKKTFVEIDYVNRISGLRLSGKEICDLLEKARYEAKLKGRRIQLLYPAYRQDIMHARDIVEDAIISYGYNKIKPLAPRLPTIGGSSKIEVFSNSVAEVMIGLGLQEIISYNLTNKENLFKKMNLREEDVVEIENPVSANWDVLRSWLLPSVIEFLSNNKHVDYPQKVFEIGDAVVVDETRETKTRDERKLACVIADNKASYESISSLLDSLLTNLGVKYKLKAVEHPSFIPGRTAEVIVNNREIGIIGEIHPSVIDNWKLEVPLAGFEIDVELLSSHPRD